MFNAGIFAESTTDRIHRYNIFGVVVFDCGKIAELPLHSVCGGKEICHLNVYSFIRFGCYEVNLSGTKNADSYFKPMASKMIPDYILNYFLDTAQDIETA